jgi:hypothetical protein
MSDNLAKARAAVAPLIAHDTGDRPRWRIIHTDSESPSGVALACTGENSDALHMIDDYPGGPIRDEEGVYDCCPWPQFETYSPVLAAYLVELLNADAEEKATDAQSATATPGLNDRQTRLLDAIRSQRGHWKTGRVLRFYQQNNFNSAIRTARFDLEVLRDAGHITQHDTKGVRFYTYRTKDSRS